MIESNTVKNSDKITTVKLNVSTKNRVEHLRMYRRETYDEIVQRMLEILNICRVNPEHARSQLIAIDRAKRKEKIKSSISRRISLNGTK